jgi:mono/diheme cytochrome c family protein
MRAVVLLVVALLARACGGVEQPGTLPDQQLRDANKVAVGLPVRARPGARLFFQSGCLTCHVYAGYGSSNLNAPDLTHEARRERGLAFQIRHLNCPTCTTPGSPMPPFASLGDKWVREIAIFLEASR